MQIYCIRHGESSNNILEGKSDYLQKRSCEPLLTETGRKQAECAAKYIAEYISNPEINTHSPRAGKTKIFTSYMLRAVQTAEYIGRKTDIQVHAWKDLHERGGCLEFDDTRKAFKTVPGYGKAYYSRKHPDLYTDSELKECGWNSLKNPEQQRGCYLRAKKVLEKLTAMPDDQTVILVSHRLFISALLSVVLKADHAYSDRLYSHNTGISCIQISSGIMSIRFHNRFHFLPEELSGNTV
ncbi:histidine phosphatase family protein [Spirochaeta dissipatitropha]